MRRRFGKGAGSGMPRARVSEGDTHARKQRGYFGRFDGRAEKTMPVIRNRRGGDFLRRPSGCGTGDCPFASQSARLERGSRYKARDRKDGRALLSSKRRRRLRAGGMEIRGGQGSVERDFSHFWDGAGRGVDPGRKAVYRRLRSRGRSGARAAGKVRARGLRQGGLLRGLLQRRWDRAVCFRARYGSAAEGRNARFSLGMRSVGRQGSGPGGGSGESRGAAHLGGNRGILRPRAGDPVRYSQSRAYRGGRRLYAQRKMDARGVRWKRKRFVPFPWRLRSSGKRSGTSQRSPSRPTGLHKGRNKSGKIRKSDEIS